MNFVPPARFRSIAAHHSAALLFRFGVAALLLIALAGCKQRYTTTLPTAVLQLGARQYTVEIAADDNARETGLMFRPYMPPDYGMIFVFNEEQPENFYMKNTQIPLDIIFMDHTGRVVSIKTMQPLDLRLTPSDGPASFAVELNAGQAAATALHVGDVVSIPAAIRQPVSPAATSP
jgi:uncharacterized protein